MKTHATEETKPVEREAFEAWVKSLPKCLSYDGGCDGDLVGLDHEPNCPMHGKKFATCEDAFFAAWDAALERAAALAEEVAKEVGGDFSKSHQLNVGLNTFMVRLRALKGSR